MKLFSGPSGKPPHLSSEISNMSSSHISMERPFLRGVSSARGVTPPRKVFSLHSVGTSIQGISSTQANHPVPGFQSISSRIGVHTMPSVHGVLKPKISPSFNSVVGTVSFNSIRRSPTVNPIRSSGSEVRLPMSVSSTKPRKLSPLSSSEEGFGKYLNFSASRALISVIVGSLLGCALGYGTYNVVISYQSGFGNALNNFSAPPYGIMPGANEVSQQQNMDFSPFLRPKSGPNRVGINDEYCGRRYQPNHRRFDDDIDEMLLTDNQTARIIGGNSVNMYQHPWQVSLWAFGKHVCGGSVIASNWVLFAAHCITPFPNARDWLVNAGESDQRLMLTKAQAAHVTHIIKHQDFSEDTFDCDIALLRLNRHFTMDHNVNTVCLPTTSQSLITGALCEVSGWGAVSENGPLANILQAVRVTVIDRLLCNSKDWLFGLVTKNMFCAGELTGKRDACQGDSGGPLTCGNSQRTMLMGVVSWGVGCGEAKTPGVYTHLGRFYPWIRQEISKYEGNLSEENRT